MKMNKIAEVKKKLNFADYLLNRTYAEAYPAGAIKHLLEAANLLVIYLTNLDENRLGPQIIKNKLDKLEDKESQEFSKFYLELWQLNTLSNISKEKARASLEKLKKFTEWVENKSVEEPKSEELEN